MAEIKIKRSGVAGKVPTVADLALGELAINTYDGLAFIKKNVSGVESVVTIGGSSGTELQKRYQYTATASQTTFAAQYTAPYVDVYLNGSKLVGGVDYTATNGTSIMLATAATADDQVEIVGHLAFGFANSLPLSGGTLTGELIVDDNLFTIEDNTDSTKKARFELSGLTTATTRTYTLPDASGTVALLSGTQTFSGGTTFSTAVTMSGTTAAYNIGTSATSGVLTMGGTSGTGIITLGRSTVSQTTNIQAGATASGSTKTLNLGTGGLTGSITTMAIGSTFGTTVAANGTWTFASPIAGSITGSAASITGVYGGTLTSGQVTGALGFTPYDSTNPSGYTTNTGTVTSVGGTGTVSGITLTGTVTSTGNLTLGGTLAVTASNFASQTANTVLAAPNGTAGIPTFRTLVAADIPTLNQNTTGSAATLTTGRTISLTGDVAYTSDSFNGSANVTGTATLAAVGTAGTYTKVTTDSKGRVTSGTTLAATDIPALDASKITSGTIDAARLPSYVDDVIEAANLAAFPATGEAGKIYVALDTNKTYRWSGSAYIYITSGAVDSVAGKTGVVTLVQADISGLTTSSSPSFTGVTLSGGTSNGVAYLNGSKVLTTGSALTFDGTTTFGVVGSGNGIVSIGQGTSTTTLQSNGQDFYLNMKGTGATVFRLGSSDTEQMRLTSTGLGLGTSSPTSRLVVQQAQNTGDGIRLLASGSDTTLLTRYLSSIDAWQITSSYGTTGAYKPIAWFTSDLERMRLDASGNLGIGKIAVSGYRLDIGSSGDTIARLTAAGQANGLEIGQLTADGSNKVFAANNNFLAFGTNNTERARIDASGNVGIGLTPVAGNGILQLGSYASVQALMEKVTVSATAATGTINLDVATQAVLYYTTNASANWTLNLRASSTATLNNIMQTGQSVTLAFLATNGATAYYQTGFQIDGTSVTPKWQGGTAPTSGNASSVDVYSITVIKTAASTFTVLASLTKFA